MAVHQVTRMWSSLNASPSTQSPTFATLKSTKLTLKCLGLTPTKMEPSRIRAAVADTREEEWETLDADVDYLTRSARLVQWYPGHIAKAERSLKEQLKLMDVVIEVRDARIPLATAHPEIDEWMGDRKKLIVLNREDMVSTSDKNAWGEYFAKQGISVLFTNGQRGAGTMKLARMAKSVSIGMNFLAESYFL